MSPDNRRRKFQLRPLAALLLRALGVDVAWLDDDHLVTTGVCTSQTSPTPKNPGKR